MSRDASKIEADKIIELEAFPGSFSHLCDA